MAQELKNLPFALTSNNKVIAEVCTQSKVACTHKVLPMAKRVHNAETAIKDVLSTPFKQKTVPEPDPYFKPLTKEHQARKKAK